MDRFPKDVRDTRKEGSLAANQKLNELLEMAKEYLLVIENFNMNLTASLMDMYENGYGFKNIPDNDIHFLDPTTGRSKYTPEPPYIGYGWYVKHIKKIQNTDIIDMQHLMSNIDPTDFNNIYVIFSERKSSICRPCEAPPPQYIGFCKSVF